MEKKLRGFDLIADLGPIMAGKVELPNMKELTLEQGIASIAAAGGTLARPDVESVRLPGSTRMAGEWARYFLNRTQGGRFDGTGFVIWYGSGKGRVATFAICKHEPVAGADARPHVGYHPARCGKCGLDMTVDSSD